MNSLNPEALLLDVRSAAGYVLNHEQTFIGREPSCQIHLTNDAVSRQHAVITRKEDGWYLKDLSSMNGVTLNGCQIIPQLDYRLQNDSVVGFANEAIFRFTSRESDLNAFHARHPAKDQTVREATSAKPAFEAAQPLREEKQPSAPLNKAPAPGASKQRPEPPVSRRKQAAPTKKRGPVVLIAVALVAVIGTFCAAFFLTEGFKSKQVRSLEDSIDAIGEVTLASDGAIRSVRQEYDQLSESDRNRVDNLAVLESAEAAYQTLLDKDAAKHFDEELAQLGEITLNSGDAISALRSQYDALTAGAKSFVTQESLLIAAEKRYRELLYDQQAAEVDAMIYDLGEISLESESELLKLRQTVDALQQEVKSRLGNLELLAQKEQELAALKERNAYDQVVLATKRPEGRSAIEATLDFLSRYPNSSYRADVENLCENAYTQYAKTLENQRHWEEAQHILEECIDKNFSASKGAAQTALNNLMRRIESMRPVNGRVLGGNCRGGYCQLVINNSSRDALIKIQSVQDPEKTYLLLYVRADETAKVNIRDGSYTMKYATGDTWYGDAALFGENTKYTLADTTIVMSTTYSGYTVNYTVQTITLYAVIGGNMSTSAIDGSDF